MTPLDPTTLFVASGLVIVVTGISFILETLLRRNDQVGRLWSVFYLGSIFAVFASYVGASSEATWWAYPIGQAFYVAALGLVWAGTRQANRTRSMLALPVGAGLVVATIGLITGPVGAQPGGSIPMFLFSAAFLGAAAVESARRELGRLAGGRLLAILLSLAAVFYLGRAVAGVLLGVGHDDFQAFFGVTTASLVEIAVAVIGTLTLSSIQADRFRRITIDDAAFGTRLTMDGVVGRDSFRELSESWLMRSIRERTTLVLLLVEVADLAEVNLAFGRAAGDAAIRTAGRLVLVHAPTAALVGHISPRRFALLMKLPSNDSVEAIADRIADAVLSTPIDDQDRFRASTFCGIATTRTSGARFDDLLRDAADAVAVEREAARALARDTITGAS